jgi:hypothetical protein
MAPHTEGIRKAAEAPDWSENVPIQAQTALANGKTGQIVWKIGRSGRI